ncbi:SIS domain-containing protein [Antarcticibacterium sp. 1MA-6-2]|uniref:SIS domain-containing protein n=1 Tax=Antarcticibacterium sp. 1MA-6-2 TaxID=2908210 RepID=UPI001F2B890A|nr:SIS domain-containing protein [Antarcticibacterium sp. 1MA-6-2]UJH90184.1 SIS domain-containing protein [Antarcticibacterium sp. 1MA-6-2]
MATQSIKRSISYTATEIEGQPKLWEKVHELLTSKSEELSNFLSPILQQENLHIILTGAGSSAFIGEAAQGLVQKNTGRNTRAIATTDLVTHPDLYFQQELPTLLISFARSGNSPESLETLRIADNFVKNVYHLIITCNQNGKLLKYALGNAGKSMALLLPKASNDKSLAIVQ